MTLLECAFVFSQGATERLSSSFGIPLYFYWKESEWV